MTGEQTYVGDDFTAQSAVGHAYLRAQQLHPDVAAKIAAIRAIEADAPWGTSEAGKAFLEVYDAPDSGSATTLGSIDTTAGNLETDLYAAAGALQATIDTDNANGAALGTVDPGGTKPT